MVSFEQLGPEVFCVYVKGVIIHKIFFLSFLQQVISVSIHKVCFGTKEIN